MVIKTLIHTDIKNDKTLGIDKSKNDISLVKKYGYIGTYLNKWNSIFFPGT